MNSNLSIKKKVASITSDLRLIREVTRPSPQERICPPKNLSQLSNLLKKKNMNILASKDEKQKGQQWLAEKGVDVSPLVEKLKVAKEKTSNLQVIKKKQEDCYFYISEINQTKEAEYLNKAVQFSTLGLLQRTMSSRDLRKEFTRRVINKLRGKDTGEYYSKKQQLGTITKITTQFRSESKKNQYIKCVEKMIKNHFQCEWLAEQLSNTIQSKIWKILNAHMQAKTIGQTVSHHIMEMLIASLHMVEKQYDDRISSNDESINYYLSNNYLEKMINQDFVRDNQHGSFYGKLFILYRAGRKAEFYNLLSSRNETQLIDKFLKVQNSIEKKDPITLQYKNNVEDVFLNQLIHSLKGEAKYSSQYLSNPNNLDFIWIVLRNIGIFYKKTPQPFESVRLMILDNYKTLSMTTQHIVNLMYVLAYDQIVKIGVNELMDQDDYLHFLLCISQTPVFMPKTEDKDLVDQKLSQCLITYIFQLISLGRSEYLYYMSLFPQKHAVSQLSSIISTSQLVNVINWSFLKDNMSLKIYTNLVSQTLSKYLRMTSDYIMVAEKYNQLLNDKQKTLKILLQMLVRASHSNIFLQNSIQNAENLAQKIIMSDKNLEEVYDRTIKLLIQNRRLVVQIAQRDDDKLYQIIIKTDFVILDGIVRQKNKILLQNLIKFQGFQVYFIYLKNITRAVEICMLRRNQAKQLRQFCHKLYNSMKQLLKMQIYRAYSNKDVVVNVINTLKESLFEK